MSICRKQSHQLPIQYQWLPCYIPGWQEKETEAVDFVSYSLMKSRLVNNTGWALAILTAHQGEEVIPKFFWQKTPQKVRRLGQEGMLEESHSI